jgi:AhpD family alkylhydroperoxidase
LTKPIGTGITAFASQIGRAYPKSTEATAKSMATLNREASALMVEFGAHACTDVTGFSLMGHLGEMALSSGVDVEVIWDDIPVFPHLLQYVADGILPGAIERNKESCGERVIAGDGINAEMLDMCFDAQTSGGLLIAIDPADVEKFLKALHDAGVAASAIVGKVMDKGNGKVHVVTTGKRQLPAPRTKEAKPKIVETKPEAVSSAAPAPEETPCCAEDTSGGLSADGLEGPDLMQRRFLDFMGSVNRPGGLDAYTKQAMAIALSVAQRCEPCIKSHINKAREKGFSEEEIDEAAWMGVAFGGAPCMMFYKQHKPRK